VWWRIFGSAGLTGRRDFMGGGVGPSQS